MVLFQDRAYIATSSLSCHLWPWSQPLSSFAWIRWGPQLLLAHFLGPHLQDDLLQLGNRRYVLALQLPFHEVPGVINWIQSGKFPGQYGLEGLGAEEVPDPLWGVAWSTILKELCAAVHSHEGQEVVFRHTLNHSLPLLQDPEKHGHTIRLAGCLTIFTVWQESNRSVSEGLLTMLLINLMHQDMLSSMCMTVLQSSAVKWWYCLAKASQFFFILSVRRGFWTAILGSIFSFSFMRLLICFTEMVATSGAGGCCGILPHKPFNHLHGLFVDDRGLSWAHLYVRVKYL